MKVASLVILVRVILSVEVKNSKTTHKGKAAAKKGKDKKATKAAKQINTRFGLPSW